MEAPISGVSHDCIVDRGEGAISVDNGWGLVCHPPMNKKCLTLTISLLTMSCRATTSGAPLAEEGEAPFHEATVEAFTIEMTCSVLCAGTTETQVDRIATEYDPIDRGLVSGNGDLLGGLALDVELFLHRVAMKHGSTVCGSQESILEISWDQVASGNWNYPVGPNCKDTKRVSPFANKSQLSHSSNFPVVKAIEPEGIEVSSEKGQCQHPIEATLCYGDCLVETDRGWQEMLADIPRGTENVVLCGDPLAERIRVEGWSYAVSSFHCREFFWQAWRQLEDSQMVSACAALRGDVGCRRFLSVLGL